MASSWVDIDSTSDFSLANLPFGIISTAESSPHPAVAIGSHVLDLQVLSSEAGFLDVFPGLRAQPDVFREATLNSFAALGRAVHREVRETLKDLLSKNTSNAAFLRDNEALRRRALLPQQQVKMHLPMRIGDYTDFYAGYHHAYAAGVMFRGPQNALQPNYTHLPVAYHGRSSSIVVSGTPIRRPVGQILLDPGRKPEYPVIMASRKLDMELELGCFIATANDFGEPIDISKAEDHIFGYVLLNDWSARDIQRWEYVPLGPFNGKNFATTISPWVVLADALEPYRSRGIVNDTEVQGYLKETRDDSVFDIRLEVDLTTPEGDTTTVSKVSSKNLIWSFPQMIAHHTLGGCPLRPGDLLGSGTISGTLLGERGSLLEMSQDGKQDVLLHGMDARTFLKDGDTITFRGAAGPDGAKVGFGECVGRIFGAR